MAVPLKKLFEEAKLGWADLGAFARFERLISLLLMVLTTIVTLFATGRLAINLFQLFVVKADFLDYEVFQTVFGMIMTILIALEFNRSIATTLVGRSHLLQIRTVILIGILALVRKFVILDVTQTSPMAILGLSAAVLALAVVYWVFKQDQRIQEKG